MCIIVSSKIHIGCIIFGYPLNSFNTLIICGFTVCKWFIESKIIIKNLDCNKRPINAAADNVEVKNAKFIKIQINKKLKFTLLYNKNSSLEKKIKIEQSRKETKINYRPVNLSTLTNEVQTFPPKERVY